MDPLEEIDHSGERANRERSDIALNWMLAKAQAAGLPVPAVVGTQMVGGIRCLIG